MSANNGCTLDTAPQQTLLPGAATSLVMYVNGKRVSYDTDWCFLTCYCDV